MSGQGSQRAGELKQTERIRRTGGPHGGAAVGEKAEDFWSSARRLLVRMRPERLRIALVLLFTVVSVAASAVGPRILGHATDLVFAGLLGGRLSPDVDKETAVAELRAAGENEFADLVQGTDVVPGRGVDFSAVAEVLVWVLVLYVVGAVVAWLAGYVLNGLVQDVVRQLRADVEAKLHRLPLGYFDRQPRGELLSRATNDIDNVAQSLQQTLSQLLTALLTVVAVLGMMLWISPLLALVALVSIPASMVVAGQVMKRSQSLFIDQWRRTGALNSLVEENYSGHALVRLFGHRAEAAEQFRQVNDELYQASWRAQFVSGLVMPIMTLVGNVTYVLVAVVGALRVTTPIV